MLIWILPNRQRFSLKNNSWLPRPNRWNQKVSLRVNLKPSSTSWTKKETKSRLTLRKLSQHLVMIKPVNSQELPSISKLKLKVALCLWKYCPAGVVFKVNVLRLLLQVVMLQLLCAHSLNHEESIKVVKMLWRHTLWFKRRKRGCKGRLRVDLKVHRHHSYSSIGSLRNEWQDQAIAFKWVKTSFLLQIKIIIKILLL